jgi:hypothetical protein
MGLRTEFLKLTWGSREIAYWNVKWAYLVQGRVEWRSVVLRLFDHSYSAVRTLSLFYCTVLNQNWMNRHIAMLWVCEFPFRVIKWFCYVQHTYTLTHTHTLTHIFTRSHTYTYIYAHTHIHTQRHSHAFTLTHRHSHSHTHIYIHTQTLTHTQLHTHTFTHTQTHTHTHSLACPQYRLYMPG